VELKSELVCGCGESHPACLQLHHADPATKEISIADAVRLGWGRERILKEMRDPAKKNIAVSTAVTNGWSKPRILAEMALCRVLCANCHLKHHWDERTLRK
jgi:hypothetical protein